MICQASPVDWDAQLAVHWDGLLGDRVAALFEEQAYTMIGQASLVHWDAMLGDLVAALFEERTYMMICQASLVLWDAVLAAYIAALS